MMSVDELREKMEQDRAQLHEQHAALQRRIQEYHILLLKTEGGLEVIARFLEAIPLPDEK